MAPIAGKPFLEWLLLALRVGSVLDIILATGFEGESIRGHFGDGVRLSLRLRYSDEKEPLGTGGAIRRAASLVNESRFLVLNGDSFFRFEPAELLSFHLGHGAEATLMLATMDDASRYGQVHLGAEGRVRSFSEKSSAGRGLVNAGVYLLEQEFVHRIPVDRIVSLERDMLPAHIERGIFGLQGDGPLVDIGTPESFAAAPEILGPELARLSHIADA